MDIFFQVSANRAIEAVRENSEKIQAWALSFGQLPPDPAGAIAMERPVRDEIDHYVAADKIASLSSLFQPSTSQKRDLQESNCADSTSPIYVTSTVFSLLEGCMTPVDIGGEVSYTLDTAFIFRGERSSSTDVSLCSEFQSCFRVILKTPYTIIMIVGHFPAVHRSHFPLS